ncbi:hypothetical protein ACIP88_33670 [Streptomyces uncialis]|uniref:hypothetical protein n=1 Tax=Streptomyces uncialis TaxID=1048205 RepID=UPI003827011E
MSFRIVYADQAERARAAMSPQVRAAFDAAMASTIGKDPYGHGSSPAGTKDEPDRRLATVYDSFVCYCVAKGPRAVTAVKIVRR